MDTKGYHYKAYEQGRRFILKILPGELVAARLTEFAREEGVRHAVILSGLGSVRDVRLRGIKAGARLPITAARVNVHDLEGPLEMLSLTGNIFPREGDGEDIDCHLHVLVGKSSGDVLGGHMTDARVFASCEIVLSELVVEGVDRHLSKSGGIPTIFIAEETP